VLLIGAGDIADSGGDAEQTAELLGLFPDALIFAAGDNAYGEGTIGQYNNYFHPTWGKHKARIRPVPGNHEYRTGGAAGYFDYFEGQAGTRGQGWYSFDHGDWHIVALNSNCGAVGCAAGSAQEKWLRDDLKASSAKCTLAFLHHPLFTSGEHNGDGDLDDTRPLWQALYDAGADVILAGHDHNYERFAPQDPNGNKDTAKGIRLFVVGTGGRELRDVGDPEPNSEVLNDQALGIIKLTLHAAQYQWEFVPVEGSTFTDSGTDLCH
jgi:3',5'-cyclic AMP phosphodiesterase CpdA